jgi:hypothetical protein
MAILLPFRSAKDRSAAADKQTRSQLRLVWSPSRPGTAGHPTDHWRPVDPDPLP